MKIEINLDESRFKDLVDDELGKFTDAEIHDILHDAIRQYVMDSDVISSLFYIKKKDWSGRETGELESTYRLKEIVEKIDMEDTLNRLKTDIQTVLEEDDVIQRLAENLFYRFITNRISDMIWRDMTLQGLIESRANQVLDSRLNNQR